MKVKEYVEKVLCDKKLLFRQLEDDDKSKLLLGGFFRDLSYITYNVSRKNNGIVTENEIREIKKLADESILEMVH